MATATAINQIGKPIDQQKNKSNKATKQATKDPKRCNWRENFANPLLSGIEFRDVNSNELVHFITIQHKEIHKESTPYRITVPVNDDGTFNMPRKQTFQEMIQAKRRQQNAFYGHHTSTSSVLSERAARRVSAAARRQSSALNNSAISRSTSRRLNQEEPSASLVAPTSSKSNNSNSRNGRSRSKKKKSSRPSASRVGSKTTEPTVVESEPPDVIPVEEKSSPVVASTSTSSTSLSMNTTTTTSSSTSEPAAATMPEPTTSTTDVPSNNFSISKPFEVKTSGDDIANVANTKAVHMISSMKELSRQNASLGSMDKKEIKRLLKSAPPGAALVLSNGTVIKKSRRGGARAGAGRKRSRPLPDGQLHSNSISGAQHQDSRSSLTNMSTSSDQTILTNNPNISELSIVTPNP